MARTRRPNALQRAADRFEPAVVDVLRLATRAAQGRVDLAAIEKSIARGDPGAAMAACEPALDAFEASLRTGDQSKAAKKKPRGLKRPLAGALGAGASAKDVCITDLSAGEIADAVQTYVGDSEPINVALRSGTDVPSAYKETVKHLDAAIMQHPLKADRVLYRAIPKEVAVDWRRPGFAFRDKAFVSTTRHSTYLDRLEEEWGLGDDYDLVEIHVPKGTGALDVNKVLGRDHDSAWQGEFVLGRGRAFEVTSVGRRIVMRLVR